MRIEHAYFREGARTYLAAWDVHRAQVTRKDFAKDDGAMAGRTKTGFSKGGQTSRVVHQIYTDLAASSCSNAASNSRLSVLSLPGEIATDWLGNHQSLIRNIGISMSLVRTNPSPIEANRHVPNPIAVSPTLVIIKECGKNVPKVDRVGVTTDPRQGFKTRLTRPWQRLYHVNRSCPTDSPCETTDQRTSTTFLAAYF